jgi:S1-C subfamily serine protease
MSWFSLATARVSTLEDMTFALRKHKSGETVEVVVIRGGDQVVKLRATLGSRSQ